RVPHLVAALPGTKDFPSRLARHAVAQGADFEASDLEVVQVEEPDVWNRTPSDLCHDACRVRPLDLVAKHLSLALIDRGSLVAFSRCLVPTGLQIELHPVMRRGAPDEI